MIKYQYLNYLLQLDSGVILTASLAIFFVLDYYRNRNRETQIILERHLVNVVPTK
jgi:hypothetical protein